MQAEGVKVVYKTKRGGVTALEDLTCHLGTGEFVSVLGPSGCGKSTLLKLAAGLLKPTAGRLLLNGKPITGPRPDVGIVFQQPTLLPWQTTLKNVMLPIETLGMNRKAGETRARELLSLTGLEGFADNYPGELSGGMQQRVGIARGLVHQPSLLLMDEPFAALDAMTREHMMLELQRIWMDQKCSVVFITHSIPEAVFLSDRIIVLSSRPGRTVREVELDLPRPRGLETMADPGFVEQCNELRALFTEIVKFEGS